MKKTILLVFTVASLIMNANTDTIIDTNSIDLSTQKINEIKNKYQHLGKSYDNDYVKDILNNLKVKSEKNTLDNFFSSMKNTVGLLDKDNVLLPFIEKERNSHKGTRDNNGIESFTIFYFISEDTSIDLIRNFSYAIEKLQEIEPSVKGLLMTRGLIGGDFDSMAKYVQNLQKDGISKIEATFHPWAFDHFKLEKVPAFALSYCKKDFRFKTCENKYLVRGELSLANFFEIVSDEEDSYSKYYFKLIEAK